MFAEVLGSLWYTSNMVKPIQFSIDADLLERIDTDPEAREKGRSAFLRTAASFYLEAKERRRLEQQISAAYAGEAEAMVSEIAELIGVQDWPES